MNVIHTASPVEHANHIAAQPQFIHPVHHSFVDLSGHNLANPHPFSGQDPQPVKLIWFFVVLQSCFSQSLNQCVGLINQAAARSCSAVAQAGRSEFLEPYEIPFPASRRAFCWCVYVGKGEETARRP